MSNNVLIAFGVLEVLLALWFVGLLRKRAPLGQMLFASLFLLGGAALAVASRLAVESAFAHAAEDFPANRVAALSNGIAQGMTWVLGAFGCALMTAIILFIAGRRLRSTELPAARVVT